MGCSYIDMVENVRLHPLRASHEGNWNLHLNAIRSMIPWCFAYDSVNYTWYLSAYNAQMTTVPEIYPCVYEAFNSGQLSLQISSNNPFGSVPVDQTIETTVNKDTQTPVHQKRSIKNSDRSVRGEETKHQFQNITST